MVRKRIFAGLVSFIMLLSTAVMIPFTAVAETVQIFKDDFENGFGGWAGRGDATVSVSDTAAYSGSKSLYVSGRTVAWHGAACAKIKELRVGKTYSLSGWVMQDEGNDSEQINFQILYKDSNGKEQYKQISNAQVKKGQWVKISGNYTIPSDASNVSVYFETPSNLVNFYIDDIMAEGEPNTGGEDIEGFNDDFENGNASWSGRGDAQCTIVSNIGNNESSCLYTTGRKNLWNGPACNKTLVLNAGNYYKFSGWVMYNGDSYSDTQKFSMNLQYQQDGSERYYEISNTTAVKGQWAHIEGEYTLPENASNFSVYFQTAWKPDANVQAQDLMDFYIDDVSAALLPPPAIEENIPSLKDAYSDYFKIGCASTATELATKATQDLIKKHYNSLTLGNELKPDSTLDLTETKAYLSKTGDQTNPMITLQNASSILKFAEENNISVRGHVLVWHSQTPDWFFKENYESDGQWVSKEIMLKRLENYIKNIMTAIIVQYPNLNVYAWDVVNEAAAENGGMREPGSNNIVSGQSAWVQVFGDDSFIESAFIYARKYAPEGCKLFYNDYNEYAEAKRDYIYNMCKKLADKGLIDGIGMQSHIKMSYPSVGLYEDAIRKYASLGLEIQVTELDVDQKSNTKEDQLALAQRYKEIFNLYKNLKDEGINISAVILWGITDATSWIGGYPLLFDKNYQAKESFYAVIDPSANIQTISSASSIKYDGTDKDIEKAFAVQKENNIGSAGSFKSVWNDNNIIVRANSNVNGNVSVYIGQGSGNNPIIKTYNIKSGDTVNIPINISELDIKVGASIDFEVLIKEISVTDNTTINYSSWNTLKYDGDGSEICYGKLNFKSMPVYTEALKGTPAVDGAIDDIWLKAQSIDVNNYTMGSGAYGTAKTLWDENYIYVLVEVKDSNLSKSNVNAYEQDTVEVFFDENNGKTTAYEIDDIQARINYDNDKTVTDGKSIDDFISAAKTVNGGYIVEIAFPYTLSEFKSNQIVGYDVQINDDGGEGKRTSIANWSDLTGQGYINTSNFGVLKLVNDDERQVGDINSDGQITIADLILLNKYLTKSVKYIDILSSDINGDEVINVFDSMLLRNLLLK